MANIKKAKKDVRKIRTISLSDNEVKEIEKITGEKSLTLAIRELIKVGSEKPTNKG